jgi:apolipoprotein N-acyltransferase
MPLLIAMSGGNLVGKATELQANPSHMVVRYSYKDLAYRDYLYAFLAGLLLVFAFAPFEWRWFAWLSPALFFWLNLKPMSRGQCMRLAWVYGTGLFAGGVHWIYVSIHFFGGANSFIAAIMVLAFVLFVALTLMLFGGLVRFFPNQTLSSKLLIIFPAAWGLTEWFRGWFLTGFPWLQLGHSQADTWLAAYAPIIGSPGISWIVALGAGALVLLVMGGIRERTTAVSVLVLTTAIGFGLGLIQWTKPHGEPLYVSLIQGNIAQEEKWVPALRSDHIRKHWELMSDYVSKSDLVIWPETAIPDTFQRSMEDVILPLQEISTDLGNNLLVGGFHYEPETAKTYNSVMSVGREELDVYGKRHLVPFSEYTPFLEYLRWLENFVVLPYDNVAKWRGKTNLTVAGQPMRISICYEDAFGEEIIEGLPEATMLVNLSNNGWFTGSIQPYQHAEIARMRAIETGRYLLRATNNGISAIINERGENLHTAKQYQDAVIAGYAQPMQGSTPYIIWGNWFLIPLLSLLLFGVWWRYER